MTKTTECINLTLTNIYDGDESYVADDEDKKTLASALKTYLENAGLTMINDVTVEYAKCFLTEE